ncbi:MAG TPA: class I adenylate-forming enzyme family protein [Acidimicrobiales bacterium]|jgi:acyl-CoA synthetase (AMP-forming)/AMP-acid ligase II|nr:class I adenylate-forming enzyme family protein [Acidimicrobiales bacterium]
MLASTVTEAARRFGGAIAFAAADGWHVSFRDLDQLSDEAAVGLAARGVGARDVVALLLPSTPDYVVAYAALAKLGATTVGVNPRLALPEQAAALSVVGPKLALASPDVAPSLPGDLAVVDVAPAAAAPEILAGLRRGHRGDAPPPSADEVDRPVAIVLTSGTTGTPKGAWFTNRELAAITAFDVGDRWGGGAPMLASTQFAHIGFMTKLPWYLRLGGTTHLLHRWRAADVLDLVERTRMPVIGTVAPQVALMLRDPRFDQRDLSCVQALIAGAGPSSPALVDEARRRFGAAYSIRYSSTESGGVGTGTAFDADDDEALHSVGRPRDGIDLEIRDESDRAVPLGETGEVCLRSPAMFRGYWNAPEETARTLRGGWLHSGDLGWIDERGLLHLAGRSKEMYIRGGYNVFPLEVEAVLEQHPAVSSVAIVPRPDPVMGEIGVAVVVARPGVASPSLDDLRSFAADRLAHHKLPEAMRVVDELPLTAVHKLDRRRLAAHEQPHTDPTT